MLLFFQYNEEVEVDPESKVKTVTRCVLELSDDDRKKPLIEVDPNLIRKLKPHQVEGN